MAENEAIENLFDDDIPKIDGDMLIVKENSLARSAMQLTTAEHRLVNVISSLITPADGGEGICKKRFFIKDYCSFYGLSEKGNHTQMKNAFLSLRKKSFVIYRNGDPHITGWINTATIKKGEGIVEVTIDERILPFLLYIKNNTNIGIDPKVGYIKHKLNAVKYFTSEAAFTLYSFLKTHIQNKSQVSLYFTVEEFRKILMVGPKEYSQFTGLKTRVILPAIAEINGDIEMLKKYKSNKKLENVSIAPTDIHVSFTERKNGRKIAGLDLLIKQNSMIHTVSIDKDDTAEVKDELLKYGYSNLEIRKILKACRESDFDKTIILENAYYARSQYTKRKYTQMPVHSLIGYAISCIKNNVVASEEESLKPKEAAATLFPVLPALPEEQQETADVRTHFTKEELEKHLTIYANKNKLDLKRLYRILDNPKMSLEKLSLVKYLFGCR